MTHTNPLQECMRHSPTPLLQAVSGFEQQNTLTTPGNYGKRYISANRTESTARFYV